MILVNFAHPLTQAQLDQVERLARQKVERVIDVKTQFDHETPFAQQAQALIESVTLSSQEWQTLPLLVNLPSLNVIAALVLVELHGRMGYFPAVLRLRPIPDTSGPPRFEVAEILDLHAAREAARGRR
jgi:hypothetical protein